MPHSSGNLSEFCPKVLLVLFSSPERLLPFHNDNLLLNCSCLHGPLPGHGLFGTRPHKQWASMHTRTHSSTCPSSGVHGAQLAQICICTYEGWHATCTSQKVRMSMYQATTHTAWFPSPPPARPPGNKDHSSTIQRSIYHTNKKTNIIIWKIFYYSFVLQNKLL